MNDCPRWFARACAAGGLAIALAGCTTTETAPDAATAGPAPLAVGLLLLDGVYNTELVAPMDVFQHTIYHTKPGMRVFTVGRTNAPIETFEGLEIRPDYALDGAPKIDVLVIPSGEHSMNTDLEDLDLIQWVADRGADAEHVMSLCDGAFVLAEAGLLRGRECTTFPGDIPAFRREYPHLDVVEDVSFVVDEETITAAGGAKSYDPALYLVETLFGRQVAEGVARGITIDWTLESVPHRVVRGTPRDAETGDRPRCFLPGESIPRDITVEHADGTRTTLGEIADQKRATAIVLCLLAGAEAIDYRKRGGLWCEDTFNDLPLIRHLMLDYAERGVRFVAVACPPVYHPTEFGYTEKTFLDRTDRDPIYIDNRARFVNATQTLVARDVLPFSELYYDTRFRLLANPARGVPAEIVGQAPAWQGKFKWYRDTQAYGTPTIWVLSADLRVEGAPFFMNVYESEGRHLNYTARDVRARLDRVLRDAASDE